MKQIINRGSFLTLMFMLLGCLSLYAADNDLITKQITITLEKAGTLPDRIGSSKKYKITNLKIIGEINSTDLKMIREMAGSDNTDGKLSVLDLSEAKIVEGGDCYYNDICYTSNDVIGSNAFRGCSGLTSLTLPAGITEIGDKAFWNCSGLTSIYVYAEKVPKIGSNAFEGIDAKKCTLYVPMGTYSDYWLSDFGDYFENIVDFEATGIDKITINLEKAGTLPDRIGSSKKYKITNLKIIGEINGTDLRMIREMAGSNSTDGKLSVLDLSEAKIVEGGDCYYNNYYTSNDVIGSHAFDGCSGLTSLNLPASITFIDIDAFAYCSGLTSLNLPAGITSIGDRAFWNCSGLTSIYVYAEKVPEIGSNVFVGVDAKECTLYVPMGTRDDYWLSVFGDYFENIVEFDANKITINLEKAGTLPGRIGSSRKYKVTNLKIIGEINGTDLRMIREMAGRNPGGSPTDGKLSVLDLSEAKIVEGGGYYYYPLFGNKNYYTSNDVIGDYAFKDCSGLTSLTLPAGITYIGKSAFYGCSGLTSLTLPDGITSIGNLAFYGCSGLTSLILPAGITSIGDYAFKDCSGLTSLTLPAGITEIGHYAFRGCSGLTSIYVYAEKVPKIGNSVFERVDDKKCTLYVPMGTRGDYRFSDFGDYFENIVEFEATGIDKTTTSTDVEEVARYSVNGQRLSAPTKGLNIVKYSDGSVKKVAVR